MNGFEEDKIMSIFAILFENETKSGGDKHGRTCEFSSDNRKK
ncbi:hypothetical protein [Ekhidna sp.]